LRPAEDEQPANPAHILWRGVPTWQVEIAMMNAALAEHVDEESEPLGLYVAKHQPRRTLPRAVPLLAPTHHGPPLSACGGPPSRCGRACPPRASGIGTFTRPSRDRHGGRLR